LKAARSCHTATVGDVIEGHVSADVYDVLAFDKTGKTSVFASRR
jgi:hypothetical protein